MKEFMLIRFPSQLCVDGGRAAVQRSRRELAANVAWRTGGYSRTLAPGTGPKGFRLAAQIVDFPDGVPGDAALFLTWEA